MIIASDGDVPGELGGWEHVSVSTDRRIPNWIEMSFVKNLFWAAEECVVQYHPPQSEYVNNHPRVLHLWRWTKGDFPMPPNILVGRQGCGDYRQSRQGARDRAPRICRLSSGANPMKAPVTSAQSE
jgi:hypothetical protein